ncbi:MAG: glycosyltransferase family 2 protein [Candidatus Aminicenantes bacterium]|nr:glycosyltransferase family 2 protein [Candidatus Aminicenantes bacterium]
MKISVAIIAFNEGDRIADALKSCRSVADECLVVDSGSTDDTAAVARALGARVVQHPFRDFGSQKNVARKLCRHEWVLNLDADERISPELARALVHLKQHPPGDNVAGFRIRRKTAYLGRWIRHGGWYPDRKLRLFHRDRAIWNGRVHESLDVNGSVDSLPGHILHFTYRDMTDHVSRLNRYSTMQAEDMAARGKRFLLTNAFLRPPLTFLRCYFWRGGFRDGFPGLVIALLTAWNSGMKFLKARSLRKHLPPPPWDVPGH